MLMIFSILAWLRAIAITILFLHCSFSYAQPRDEILFASSVTYCDPPEAILVDQLDVTYYNQNQSIFFNITAASVSPHLNVSANVLVNVYGMTPFNLTLDLCEILGGALCPLPEYTFRGTDTLTLPSSLNIASFIPSIAFAIPDLEGFAQIKLTEVETGDVKACIQVTVSNGWSAQQTAVSWTTAAIAIVVLLISLWVSANAPNSILPHRFLDMMCLFQTIAFSAFLDLNYPSLYRAFTLNFSWALGLFTSPESQVQQSIDNMRALTGGSMANSTDSAIAYVNRKLSPYNFDASGASSSSFSLFKKGLAEGSEVLSRRDVDTVTEVSSNVLDAGVPLYTNSLHIGTANAFMTVFLHTLSLIAIFGGLFAVLYLVPRCVRKLYPKHADACDDFLHGYVSYVRTWSLRVFLVLACPLLVFSTYQWTLHDSWLSILLAVFVFVAVIAGITGVSFVLLREARRANALVIYSDSIAMQPYSPLIGRYHAHRFYLFFPSLVLPLFKAIVIAGGKQNGLAQLIVLMIIELSTVLMPIVLRPHKTRGGDIFSTYLALVRFVCTGLMIAFMERLNVGAILRVVIGCVIGVVFCANIIVLIVNILIHIYHVVRPHAEEGTDKSVTDCGTEPASWEKRSDSTFVGGSQFTHVRPRNPTPDCNLPLDPTVREAYPEHTPPSTSNDHFTRAQRDSVSTTLGSILPRRFSITPLSSPESFEFEPTVTGSSHGSSTTLDATSLVDSSNVGHCSYNGDRSFRS